MTDANPNPPPAAPSEPQSKATALYVLVGVVVVAALVVYAIVVLKPKTEGLEGCIETVFIQNKKTASKEQIGISAEAAKLGKMDLTADDQAAIEYRKDVPIEVQLEAIQTCRAKHVAPEQGGGNKPLEMKMNARVSVEVKQGSRTLSQKHVLVNSTHPNVRECTTSDSGQCDLPIENVKSDETLIIQANFDGLTRKEVPVKDLLKGVTLLVPPKLKEVKVQVRGCHDEKLGGQVTFDGDDIYKKGCSDISDVSCKSAMLENGDATFRYDPEAFKKATLRYAPDRGKGSEHEIVSLSNVLPIRFCQDEPRLPTCSNTLSLKLKNEAVRAAGAGVAPAAVSFTVRSKLVAVSGAPAAVATQLNGKAASEVDCNGSFRLP